MKYPERIAVDLARVVGVEPGSILYHGIVGALAEVIEHCAETAQPGCGDLCGHDECKGARDAVRHVRELLTNEEEVSDG